MTEKYFVYRIDLPGNYFIVDGNLEEAVAKQLVHTYEQKNHHQHYDSAKQKPDKDYIPGEPLRKEDIP